MVPCLSPLKLKGWRSHFGSGWGSLAPAGGLLSRQAISTWDLYTHCIQGRMLSLVGRSWVPREQVLCHGLPLSSKREQ
jgi:hypothetical protein